jgi:methylglyoxal/glyoxal reductase
VKLAAAIVARRVDITSTSSLNSGRAIPLLGLGVFRSGKGKSTQNAVRWALEAGYRHIDTAHIYGNEADVGTALRASGVPREQVFVIAERLDEDRGTHAPPAA